MKKLFVSLFLILFSFSPILAQDEESSSGGSGGTQSGFVLKGGLWGIGGSFKTQFEQIAFTDDLLSGFGFGQLDLDWTEKKKYYLLNPIGLDWFKPIGPGSLQLSFDMRGLPVGKSAFGFNPKYEYNSIAGFGNNNNGVVGIHDGELEFRYYDFVVGYQFGLLGNKLFITPKFLLRDFTNKYKESALYLGNNTVGIGNRDYNAPGYGSFLGVNLQFHFNQVSSIFLDLTFDSFIQLPLPKIGLLFDDQLEYSKSYFTNGGGNLVINGKGTQEVTGNRFLFGYQHKFGSLALRIGYHSETINSRYDSNFEIPLWFNTNGNAGISVNEILSNMLITYDQQNKTEIKSLYLMLTYSI
ncbi:MAG: hypothetical protein KDK36_04155 [Leptospiraceae bacterium]|nr:hypothetical protein [Leptospiraceae bacterium]